MEILLLMNLCFFSFEVSTFNKEKEDLLKYNEMILHYVNVNVFLFL